MYINLNDLAEHPKFYEPILYSLDKFDTPKSLDWQAVLQKLVLVGAMNSRSLALSNFHREIKQE